jgi:hypothetical protein
MKRIDSGESESRRDETGADRNSAGWKFFHASHPPKDKDAHQDQTKRKLSSIA